VRTHVEWSKSLNWVAMVERATATIVVSRKLRKRPRKREVRTRWRRQPVRVGRPRSWFGGVVGGGWASGSAGGGAKVLSFSSSVDGRVECASSLTSGFEIVMVNKDVSVSKTVVLTLLMAFRRPSVTTNTCIYRLAYVSQSGYPREVLGYARNLRFGRHLALRMATSRIVQASHGQSVHGVLWL